MALAWANGLCNDLGIDEAVDRCPFLRNIGKPTVFATSAFAVPAVSKGAKGPIFEDGPVFDTMFRLFHGRDGVVPLPERQTSETSSLTSAPAAANATFNPLAACAASISMSFGSGAGPFGFDAFMAKSFKKPVGKKQEKKPKKKEQKPDSSTSNEKPHEMGSEWLTTGNCPIAKSYRAIGGVLPLVTKAIKFPSNVKYTCPPAIVAARKALNRTSAVKALRPQALPNKILAIGCFGMMLNIPLGMWREHTVKFSPQWILAVHATVPFIAMLRKAVVMPKYAMAFTIGSAILGQAIGARAERARLLAIKEAGVNGNAQYEKDVPVTDSVPPSLVVNMDQGCGKNVFDTESTAPALLMDKSSRPVSVC
ncbi:hypothetical protein R1sor_014413 [Riccia sorocarpa]|uniref:Uncharacterized protein n=1 Tax=Riccia sorocarpa TaxID=122646 RepID=A0ABD3HD75_9MARC